MLLQLQVRTGTISGSLHQHSHLSLQVKGADQVGFDSSNAASSFLELNLAGFNCRVGPPLSPWWDWLVQPRPSLGKLGPALHFNE